MSSHRFGAGIVRNSLYADWAQETTVSYCSFVVTLTCPNCRLSIGEKELIDSVFSIQDLPVDVPWFVDFHPKELRICEGVNVSIIWVIDFY